jgi:hypothetical protein
MGITIGLTVFLFIATVLLTVFSYFSYRRAIHPKIVFMMAGIRFRLGTDQDGADENSLICVDNPNVKIVHIVDKFYLMFGMNRVCFLASSSPSAVPDNSQDILEKVVEAKNNKEVVWTGGGSAPWVSFPTTEIPKNIWDIFRTFPVG